MSINYRTLLKAAIPSVTVLGWQMMPPSKKISHQSLAYLILKNRTLTLTKRIEYLELLKEECRDIFDEELLFDEIEKLIQKEYKLYKDFMIPSTGYVYIVSGLSYAASTLDNLLKILKTQYEEFFIEGFTVRKIQVDGDPSSSMLIALFQDSTEPHYVQNPFSNTPPFFNEITLKNSTSLVNNFKAGDEVYNVFSKKTGKIISVDSELTVETQGDDNTKLTEKWPLIETEYY